MFTIITENIEGNLHEAANYLNKRAPVYAETLMHLHPMSGSGCIAVYKVPDDKVMWMWGDLRYDMSRCPVSNTWG